MRLFLAIDIPKSTQKSIALLTHEKLQGAGWTPPGQFHLTLRFLGEIDEKSISALDSALQKIKSSSFTLQPQGLGVFPKPRHPRILWLGFATEPALFQLQAHIETRLIQFGLAPETKAFRPHLSLARFKSEPGDELGAFLRKHRSFSLPPFEVSEFHLYSSRLCPKGAEHRKEQSYPLR